MFYCFNPFWFTFNNTYCLKPHINKLIKTFDSSFKKKWIKIRYRTLASIKKGKWKRMVLILLYSTFFILSKIADFKFCLLIQSIHALRFIKKNNKKMYLNLIVDQASTFSDLNSKLDLFFSLSFSLFLFFIAG